MAILQWTLERKELQQKRTALILLTLSGAIRKADEAPRCRGAENIIDDEPIAPTAHSKELHPSRWRLT
ncbi:MAG: hypothetical protein ABIU05_11865 [Nitrospirales bacterium]